MGIVQRQGIKHSLVTYTGLVIGMINVMFIYSWALTEEELGLYSFLVSTANLVVPFVLLGVSSSAVKFFPIFKNADNGHNGILFWVLTIPIIGFSIFLILCFLFENSILEYFGEKESGALYLQYMVWIPVLVFLLMTIRTLTSFISNFKRIVIPNIFNDLWIKIAIPTLALAYAFGYIPFEWFIYGGILAYLINMILIVGYLVYLGEFKPKPNFSFLKKDRLYQQAINFSAYSIFSTVGFTMATQIDIAMTGTLLNLSDTGIYRIALLVGSVVAIPGNSLLPILRPIISEKWNDQDTDEINQLYQKSSINLLIAGFFIFTLIWISLDDFYKIIPNGDVYAAGKTVVLILGFAKLIDLSTSINSAIINFSKHYYVYLVIILIMAVLNVGLNYFFITILGWGIEGVAVATMASLFSFNFNKSIYIWFKFRMQPFSKGTIMLIAITLVCYFGTLVLPSLGLPLVDIILRSILMAIIFIPLVYWSKVSPEVNGLMRQSLGRVSKIIQRK